MRCYNTCIIYTTDRCRRSLCVVTKKDEDVGVVRVEFGHSLVKYWS